MLTVVDLTTIYSRYGYSPYQSLHTRKIVRLCGEGGGGAQCSKYPMDGAWYGMEFSYILLDIAVSYLEFFSLFPDG